jgi:hypothetical protein
MTIADDVFREVTIKAGRTENELAARGTPEGG